MSQQCGVCHNLDPPMSFEREVIELRLLMNTVDGNCQICDLLRHTIEAQSWDEFLHGCLFYNRPKAGSPFLLDIPALGMSFCIYSASGILDLPSYQNIAV